MASAADAPCADAASDGSALVAARGSISAAPSAYFGAAAAGTHFGVMHVGSPMANTSGAGYFGASALQSAAFDARSGAATAASSAASHAEAAPAGASGDSNTSGAKRPRAIADILAELSARGLADAPPPAPSASLSRAAAADSDEDGASSSQPPAAKRARNDGATSGTAAARSPVSATTTNSSSSVAAVTIKPVIAVGMALRWVADGKHPQGGYYTCVSSQSPGLAAGVVSPAAGTLPMPAAQPSPAAAAPGARPQRSRKRPELAPGMIEFDRVDLGHPRERSTSSSASTHATGAVGAALLPAPATARGSASGQHPAELFASLSPLARLLPPASLNSPSAGGRSLATGTVIGNTASSSSSVTNSASPAALPSATQQAVSGGGSEGEAGSAPPVPASPLHATASSLSAAAGGARSDGHSNAAATTDSACSSDRPAVASTAGGGGGVRGWGRGRAPSSGSDGDLTEDDEERMDAAAAAAATRAGSTAARRGAGARYSIPGEDDAATDDDDDDGDDSEYSGAPSDDAGSDVEGDGAGAAAATAAAAATGSGSRSGRVRRSKVMELPGEAEADAARDAPVRYQKRGNVRAAELRRLAQEAGIKAGPAGSDAAQPMSLMEAIARGIKASGIITQKHMNVGSERAVRVKTAVKLGWGALGLSAPLVATISSTPLPVAGGGANVISVPPGAEANRYKLYKRPPRAGTSNYEASETLSMLDALAAHATDNYSSLADLEASSSASGKTPAAAAAAAAGKAAKRMSASGRGGSTTPGSRRAATDSSYSAADDAFPLSAGGKPGKASKGSSKAGAGSASRSGGAGSDLPASDGGSGVASAGAVADGSSGSSENLWGDV